METSKKPEWQITKKEWQDEAVHDHLTCCLCGTELRFSHKVDHIQKVVSEDAQCTSCGVKHRSTQHALQ